MHEMLGWASKELGKKTWRETGMSWVKMKGRNCNGVGTTGKESWILIGHPGVRSKISPQGRMQNLTS